MKSIKSFYVIIFFLFTGFIGFAQTGTIKGYAIEDKSKNPVLFASVTILSVIDSSLVKGELTDTTGHFQLNGLPNGKYILAISSIEYQKVFRGPLVIDLGQTVLDLGTLEMITDAKALAEVVVRGSKPIIERKAGSMVMNIDSKFFKTSTNALDVLKKAPGLQVKPDGSILMRNSVTPKVFIDGKDVPMTASELNNYLNNLRPEQIESIEIITNPSAKYDAQYKGIIDIRLKRDTNLGFSGSISSQYRQNLYGATANNLNLIYKTKKIAYTTQVGYANYKSYYEYNSEQKLSEQSTLLTKTLSPAIAKDISYQFGVDYSVEKNQTIGLLLKGFTNKATINSRSSSVFTDNHELNINQRMDSRPDNTSYSGNLNYEIKFKKGTLSFASAYSKYKNSDKQNIINDGIERNISTWKAKLNNDVVIKTGQADYATEFLNGKLEIGSKVSLITTTNNLQYDTLAITTFNKDPNRSNKFVYDENVLAGYVNFSKEIKKFGYKVGLRVENTDTKANSITLNQITNRNYNKLLPSFGLSYTLDEKQSLSLDYSKRLRRPNFDELNPFRFYLSAFSFAEGNPFLLPQETELITINYNYTNFSASLSIGKDKNNISQLPFYIESTNFITYLHRNTDTFSYYSLDLGYPISISKYWKMQHNLSINNIQSKITYLGKLYEKNILSTNISGSQVFSLPKKYTFDISYEFYSNSGSALYKVKPLYTINLGLQKSFYNKKLNVLLNFNDIFYSYVPKVSFRQSEILDLNLYQKTGSRRIVLQLAYNFGKSTYKAQQKTSSSADEENRAKK